LAPEKRPEFLLKAFSLVVKKKQLTRLLIVGDGPLFSQTKKQAKDLGLEDRVHFTGFQTDIRPWLNKSRFILLTSESEGLPVAVMEAMSAGLIPLTTDVGNIRDIIIYGETGFYVEKNDIQDFSQKMLFLLDMNENKAAIIRKKARDLIIENHSHETSQVMWEKNFKAIYDR
jgi:glycosyltransferase involved in cell wall biosynthesis